MTDWNGDLNDDCTLTRYGYLAQVEKMDRKRWWICITRDGENRALYNTVDNATGVPLKTGKQARRAAEVALEVLRQSEGVNRRMAAKDE